MKYREPPQPLLLTLEYAPALNDRECRALVVGITEEHVGALWGAPIWLGPSEAHVYGALREMWQPVNVEFRRSGLVALSASREVLLQLRKLVESLLSVRVTAYIGSERIQEGKT